MTGADVAGSQAGGALMSMTSSGPRSPVALRAPCEAQSCSQDKGPFLAGPRCAQGVREAQTGSTELRVEKKGKSMGFHIRQNEVQILPSSLVQCMT